MSHCTSPQFFECFRQTEQGVCIMVLLIIDFLACPVHRLIAAGTSACDQRESGRDLVF